VVSLSPKKAYQEFAAAETPVNVQQCIEQAGKQGLYLPNALDQLRRDLAQGVIPEVTHAGDD